MKLGERLRRARERQGLTQAKVAEALGVERSTYTRWESGLREPDIDTIHRVADILAVSVAYLLGETDDPTPLDQRAREILERDALPVVPIPILGVIHAGDPIPAEENVIGWTAIPEYMARGGQYFGLRVKGDCFAAGTKPIHDGDIVIVRRQPDVQDGKIAVVLWPDVAEAQLRRVYRRDGSIILRADNPAYPPEIVKRRDLTVLGIVVHIISEPAAASEA